MLEPRRLLLLRALARTGTISGAASELGYTASAVSQQLAKLEFEVGLPLFERTARSIRITDIGQRLTRHADALTAVLEEAEAEILSVQELQAGRIRVATFPSAGVDVVPRAIAGFANTHAEIELSLIEAEAEEGEALLRAADVDLAITNRYWSATDGDDGDLRRLTLLSETVVLVVPHAHPLAGAAAVWLRDLNDADWVAERDPQADTSITATAARRAGFEPRIRFRTDDFTVAQGLVAAGLGVALVPAMAVVKRDRLRVLEVRDDGLFRFVQASYRRGDRNPALAAMVASLLQTCQLTPSRAARSPAARPEG